MKFGIFSVLDHYPERPRTAQQFLTEVLRQTVYAEELGFDSFWYAEHHFHPYGLLPSPPVLIAAAAERTRRIRLGVAVSVLPFHNPLRLAEDYAVADVLSGGRINLGVGSGYLRHEFEGFRIDPQQKRERFDEALDVLRAAWSGEDVHFYGRHLQVDGTRLQILPLQRPHPPIWVAVLRPEAAEFVARKGLPVMMIPYASGLHLWQVKEVLDRFKSVYEQTSGRSPAELDLPLAFHAYVGEQPQRVRPESEAALDLYLRTRLYARGGDYDSLMESGLLLFGDPEWCIRRVTEIEATGATELLLLCNFGALPDELVRSSMRRFAEHVIPAFRPVVAVASKPVSG